MLSKGFMKIGITSMIVMISLGICIVGYKTSAEKQRKQKIEYAEMTLKSEIEKKDKLTVSVNSLFKDDQQVFLVEGLKEETIGQVASDLLTLKATVEDYGLEKNDINVDEMLIETKRKLTQKVKDVQKKYQLQVQISGLFVQPINILDSEYSENSIKETTTSEQINQIRENVGSYADDWRKVMMIFLNKAQEQAEQYEQIETVINGMLDGEKLTEKANYDTYLAEWNKLTLFKNEQMKQELSGKLDKIASLLGVAGEKLVPEVSLEIPVRTQEVEPNYVDDFGNPIIQ